VVTLADLGIQPGTCQTVAEIGAANGDLDYAARVIAAAAESGCSFVKGQIYDRATLTTRDAVPYGKGITEPATQWDVFSQQLSAEEWFDVADICQTAGVTFFASVFDYEAVDLCEDIDVPLYKIASADITHKRLIQYVAATGKPIVLSTGGAELWEIRRAMEWVDAACYSHVSQIVVLMCTLSYPTQLEDANVARVKWWAEEMNPLVGYSDHTMGISTMVAAKANGAVLIEKHFTITPGAGGDHDFAANPVAIEWFHNMSTPRGRLTEQPTVQGSPHIGRLPVEEDAVRNARRSIAAKHDIEAGTVIEENMLSYLRPGTGIPPYMVDEADGPIGKTYKQTIPAGTLLPSVYSQ